jgi:phosphate transport system substrate-binding protein
MGFVGKSTLGALAALVLSAPTLAAGITGAGSTFVFAILSKWSADYNLVTGTTVNYQPIGSDAGIALIKRAAVDFGASDAPLKPDELQRLGMGQFPLVIGGIVSVVNIEGIKSGDLKFTGSLLADIFLSKVERWDDPAIVYLNPGVELLHAPITLVYRSDGSGTTFNWTNYLSKVSLEWREKVGEGTSVAWPVGLGSNGNDGVAAFVSQTKNSIGYVECSYVLHNKMTFGLVQNRTGKFVGPAASTFQAAAATADWAKADEFYLIMTDAPGEDAYPIAAPTFVIMYKNPKDWRRSKVALEFFRSVLVYGQKQANDLDYVPLPDILVQQIEAYWNVQFPARNRDCFRTERIRPQTNRKSE